MYYSTVAVARRRVGAPHGVDCRGYEGEEEEDAAVRRGDHAVGHCNSGLCIVAQDNSNNMHLRFADRLDFD